MNRNAKADFAVTEDTAVKRGEGYLFSMSVSYKGVGAGEFVTVNDGTGLPSATIARVVFPAANGTFQMLWPEGRHFDVGLFINVGALTSGGNVVVEGQFR